MSAITHLLEATARHFSVYVPDMLAGGRHRTTALARHVAMHMLRSEPFHRSFPEIGREFGQADHTSAMYACEKIARLVAAGDARVIAAIAAIRAALDGDITSRDAVMEG